MAAVKRLALIGALALSGCATATHAPPVAPFSAPVGAGIVQSIDPARIDAVLKGFIDKGELVGVSALVFKDGREVYFGAFGAADREQRVPMTRDTLVQIFSMTKPVTGVALMQLYERGLFRLDDPVTKYIPELADVKVFAGLDAGGKPILETPRRPMTVLDLMRHTAGMTTGYSKIEPVEDIRKRVDPGDHHNTLAQMAGKLVLVPLVYHPGEQWQYSPAVDLQALMVERLSGQPFDQYLHDHIFAPLKMNDTGRFVGPERRARLAALYDRNDEGTFTRQSDDRALTTNTTHEPMMAGSAGLVSTLDDYMRFARMLENEGELDGARILRRETVRLMSTNQLPAEITERSWLPSKGRVGFGLDFAVRTAQPQGDEAAGTVGEFFWDGAANTLFWVDPINRITAVLFTQYQPFGKVPLHRDFRDAVYGVPIPSHS